MVEGYNKDGKKTEKIDYKSIEDKIESPIVVSETIKEMENYKAKTETSNPPPGNVQKPEIKREGKKRCWCGSGKMFENCHGKHLRIDKNPRSSAKEYEHKLNVRDIDEYDTPESQKEYEEKEKGEGEPEEESLISKESGDVKEKRENEYKKKEEEVS